MIVTNAIDHKTMQSTYKQSMYLHTVGRSFVDKSNLEEI